LFGSQIYTILDTYKDDALKFYGSGIDLLDFALKPEQSRNIINSWVATHTDNKIRDMMPPRILNGETLLVIANAIYFKGTWHTRFDPKDTERGTFHVGSTQKQVDMMYARYDATSKRLMTSIVDINAQIVYLPRDHFCKVGNSPIKYFRDAQISKNWFQVVLCFNYKFWNCYVSFTL
jgi:serine protease inhibitor